MDRKAPTYKNIIFWLFMLTAVAGFSMAVVYSFTKEKMIASQKAKIMHAIQQVAPAYDSITDTIVLPLNGKDSINIYRLSKAGEIKGYAVETYSDEGYSGRISLMVGFTARGTITNIEVLDHRETPGLGTKMTLPAFKDQFKGIKLKGDTDTMLKITNDGGTIDAISAATVSSRAFCDAVNRASVFYRKETKR